MIATKGYAAQNPGTDLAPWNFERREVGPHDVQFEILFCGVSWNFSDGSWSRNSR